MLFYCDLLTSYKDIPDPVWVWQSLHWGNRTESPNETKRIWDFEKSFIVKHSHIKDHQIDWQAGHRNLQSRHCTTGHQWYLATPTTDRRIFYIQSPQPTPDWGISYILSHPPSLPPHVLVNNWFSSVSTHSSFPPPHSKDPSPTSFPPAHFNAVILQYPVFARSSSSQLKQQHLPESGILLMTIRAYWSKRQVVTSSSFSELITTQLREFHMVSPQVVFTLLILLTMQSYKFHLHVATCSLFGHQVPT